MTVMCINYISWYMSSFTSSLMKVHEVMFMLSHDIVMYELILNSCINSFMNSWRLCMTSCHLNIKCYHLTLHTLYITGELDCLSYEHLIVINKYNVCSYFKSVCVCVSYKNDNNLQNKVDNYFNNELVVKKNKKWFSSTCNQTFSW